MRAGELFASRLLLVTGKGGTGKTAVAAALATTAAKLGYKVLAVEVEGRQGLPRLFDLPALGHREVALAEGITGVAIDQKAALRDYLEASGVGILAGLLNRTGIADLVTAAAPGLGDALVLSRVWEAAAGPDRARQAAAQAQAQSQSAGGTGSAGGTATAGTTDGSAPAGTRPGAERPQYDLVIVDAPPSGRVVPFLRAPGSFAGVARVGPAADRARLVAELLNDPARTRAVITTLPEQLPVTEAKETVVALGEAGIALGLLVVNQVLPDGLGADAARLDALRADAAPLVVAAEGAGLPLTPAQARALVEQAAQHQWRVEGQRRLIAELHQGADADIVELPLLPKGAANAEAIQSLARSLRRLGPRRRTSVVTV
jgi:anion-transporting  ArsA/GET3 family ATPase